MSKRLRTIYLILLGLLSVFFAEVISGSMRYPLFDIWGYLVVIPLYGLHTIILLYLIRSRVSDKMIRFSTLYFAGVLFGLYEAYLTKVLWIGLAEDSFILFHISIIDYVVLVFFWHPIFSFIIPSLVFEKVVTKTDYLYQGLPEFVRKILSKKYGIVIIMIIIGFFSAFNGTFDSLTISELSLAVPILIILYWIYKNELNHVYSFDEIIPNTKGILFCSIYLSGIYIGLGGFFQPEILTITNQVPIWISYLVFGYLFYRKLNANNLVEKTESNPSGVAYKSILFYTGIILVSGLFFVIVLWLLQIKDIMIIATWILWIISGIAMLMYSIRN
jgi:hypothetical protein